MRAVSASGVLQSGLIFFLSAFFLLGMKKCNESVLRHMEEDKES